MTDALRFPRKEQIDWKHGAPKWLLIAVIGILLVFAGHWYSEWKAANDRDRARVDAALSDAPTRYQARMSERIAVLEIQQAELGKSLEKLTVQLEANQRQSEQSNKLMARLIDVLDAQAKKGR